MATPDRPDAGEQIVDTWGREVHDRIFTPKGVVVSGAEVTNPANYAPLPLDTVLLGDPNLARLASDDLIIPAGFEGLYRISGTIMANSLLAGELAWAELIVNGIVSSGVHFASGMTGNPYPASFSTIEQLGTFFNPYIRAIHTGVSVHFKVVKFSMVRIGDNLT
jgi:hypothetical protein